MKKLAVVALALVLGGCVAYPVGGAYTYQPAYYYQPAPVFYSPPYYWYY